MTSSFDAFELFGPFFDKPELFDNLFEPVSTTDPIGRSICTKLL